MINIKNKILYLLTIYVCGCMSMFGQTDNAKLIKPLEANLMDYASLLQATGYEVFPFDISSLSDGQYEITFRFKEYKDGKEIRDRYFGGGRPFNNMRFLSDFPKDNQDKIKPENMADANLGIYSMGKRITIGFIPSVNDSIRPIIANVENMGQLTGLMRMFPQYTDNDSVNGEKRYIYATVPFKLHELKTGEFIPLVLYGSFWYDEKFKIHRFCGEKEIDPDMSSKILQYVPHYYVIGIEVQPVKML